VPLLVAGFHAFNELLVCRRCHRERPREAFPSFQCVIRAPNRQ
jgi:hypothetical protein